MLGIPVLSLLYRSPVTACLYEQSQVTCFWRINSRLAQFFLVYKRLVSNRREA